MNFKTTGLLLLVLAVGIFSVVMLDKQDEKKQEAENKAGRLLDIEKEDISEIILEPSGIHCVKDSTEWKIVSPVETEGDKSSINAIANMFSWMDIERTISSDPAEYPTFGLAPEKGRMIIVHKNGTDTLYVGDKSPTGSYVFARKSGSPDVFLTSTTLKTNVEKTLFNLRNKKAITFEKVNVRSFDLYNKEGHFSLNKVGGKWMIGDDPAVDADRTEIDKILNRLNSERAKEFVDESPASMKKYGLHRPVLQVDLYLGESRAKKSLFIGKKTEKGYYAKDEARKPVFIVDTSFVNVLNADLFTLRKKDLADFSSTDINKFELEFSNQIIVCSKDTSGTWMVDQPETRKAKSWEISSITRTAAQLEVVKFVDDKPSSLAKYGLDVPRVKARFYKDDSLLLEAWLGKQVGDDVYAKIADKKPVYLVEKKVFETWTPDLDKIAVKPEPEKTDAKSAE